MYPCIFFSKEQYKYLDTSDTTLQHMLLLETLSHWSQLVYCISLFILFYYYSPVLNCYNLVTWTHFTTSIQLHKFLVCVQYLFFQILIKNVYNDLLIWGLLFPGFWWTRQFFNTLILTNTSYQPGTCTYIYTTLESCFTYWLSIIHDQLVGGYYPKMRSSVMSLVQNGVLYYSILLKWCHKLINPIPGDPSYFTASKYCYTSVLWLFRA